MTWAMPSRYSGGLWTLEFVGTSSFRAAEGICSLATRSLSPAYVEKAQIYLETVTSEDITPSLVVVRNWKMGGPHLLESLKTKDG